MKKKIFFKVLIVVVLFIFTMILSTKFLNSLNNNVAVYTAKKDIDAHVLITEDMIEKVQIGFDEKVNFFNKAYDLKELIVGNVSTKSIKKGSVFLEDGMLLSEEESKMIVDDNGQLNSNYFLDEAERIGFISIGKNHALGGNIKKGDYIDIVFTSTTDATGGLYTSLLLQQILIHSASENNQSSGLVDLQLELEPQEALLLSLAKYNGQLDLLLTDENTKISDVLPIIPPILYEKLIEAGYLLLDESNNNTSEHQQSQNTDISELEKQISKAEADLERAFAAISAAKAALEAERNKVPEETIEDMIRRLELAVSNLEGAVSQNKTILEDLEAELTNQQKGSD